MASVLSWRNVQPASLFEASMFDSMNEIVEQVRLVETALDAQLQSLREKVERSGHEFPEWSEDLERAHLRARLVRGAYFLAAFSQFEFELLTLCVNADDTFDASHRSATDGLKQVLRSRVKPHVSDWDQLYSRIDELKSLRDELAHGGGFARETRPPQVRQLESRMEVRVEDDPMVGDVLLLADGFLERAVDDMRRAHRTCRRFARTVST